MTNNIFYQNMKLDYIAMVTLSHFNYLFLLYQPCFCYHVNCYITFSKALMKRIIFVQKGQDVPLSFYCAFCVYFPVGHATCIHEHCVAPRIILFTDGRPTKDLQMDESESEYAPKDPQVWKQATRKST